MSGLRARQKADRTSRILEAAAALFRREGYDAAKIEDIATLAQVSVGTIYNYYTNKGDLLMAIVAMEVNAVLAAGEKLVNKPPASALRAVSALISIYIEHSNVWLDKQMWRQAMAISTQQPGSPFGKTYAALDERLADQLGRLVSKLQASGALAAQLEAGTFGEILFNNMDRMFMGHVRSEAGSIQDLLKAIARQNRLLIEPYVARSP